MKPLARALLGIALGMAVGCGGGSSGTGVFSSGFETKKQLNGLSPGDSARLCQKVQRFFVRTIGDEGLCSFFGLIAADFANLLEDESSEGPNPGAVCRETRADCIRSARDFDNAAIDCSALNEKIAGCSATIEEYAACINDQGEQLEALFAGYSCSMAGEKSPLVKDGAQLLTAPPPTPACIILKAKCPAFFEDATE